MNNGNQFRSNNSCFSFNRNIFIYIWENVFAPRFVFVLCLMCFRLVISYRLLLEVSTEVSRYHSHSFVSYWNHIFNCYCQTISSNATTPPPSVPLPILSHPYMTDHLINIYFCSYLILLKRFNIEYVRLNNDVCDLWAYLWEKTEEIRNKGAISRTGGAKKKKRRQIDRKQSKSCLSCHIYVAAVLLFVRCTILMYPSNRKRTGFLHMHR